MKKALPLLLSILLAFGLLLNAGALTLEDVETSEDLSASPLEEKAQTYEEAASNVVIPPVLDPTYGMLLFYQSFQTGSDTPDYIDKALVYSSTDAGEGPGATKAIVDNPDGSTDKVIRISGANNYVSAHVNFSKFPLSPGKYRVTYDSRADDTDTSKKSISGFERFFTSPSPVDPKDSTKTKGDRISQGKTRTNGVWAAGAYTGECVVQNGIQKFGFVGSPFSSANNTPLTSITGISLYAQCATTKSATLYVDDITIYFYPANAFMYRVYGTLKMEQASGTYIVPTPAQLDDMWKDQSLVAWTDGQKVYYPGQVLEDVSVLYGKTLTPLTVPLLDESKGELILAMNFEQSDTDKLALAFANPAYLSSVTKRSSWRTDGSDSLTVVVDPTNPKNHALQVYSKQTNAHRLAVLEFPSITMVNGKFAVDTKFMLQSPENFKQIYFRFSNIASRDHSATHIVNMSDTNRPAAKKWKDQKFVPSNMSDMADGIKSFGFQMNMTSSGLETTYYIDDIFLYAFPQNAVMFKPAKDSTDLQIVRGTDLNAADAAFTFPTPEKIGYTAPEGETFVKWISSADSTKMYAAGDTVAFSELKYATFYPFYQNASLPAMGYAYEGTSYTDGMLHVKTVTSEMDDGRTVSHAYYFKKWNTPLSQWAFDARLFMPDTANAFDPKEYSIVQYSYKMENTYNVPDVYKKDKNYDENKDGAPEFVSNPGFILWYYAPNGNGGYNFYNKPSGENRITDNVIQGTADGQYHLVEYDMTKTSSNSKCPYMDCETIGGFALDIARVTYSSDVYIDYIRAYRAGVTTVTYDTNKPTEDAKVIAEVAPDTGRGLGTGYLLKGERPAVEGYVFLGWAEKPDATVADIVEYIDLKKDTTVYAVWGKPEMLSYNSIREPDEAGTTAGLRFAAAIDSKIRDFNGVTEYGFLATLQRHLDAKSTEEKLLTADDLKFSESVVDNTDDKGNNGYGDTADGVPFVWGKVYLVKDGERTIDRNNMGTDIRKETGVTEHQDFYTILLTNIPEAGYDEDFVVRAYIKIGDVYYYGSTHTCSYTTAYNKAHPATAETEEENV